MPAPDPCIVRALDRTSADERELIARRMRLTLQEVLGEEEGAALYSMEWLRERLRWHLEDPSVTAEVYLALDAEHQSILGHTIVRLESDEDGQAFGLFSTTYVDPAARRRGVARSLVQQGERWFQKQGMMVFATDTSATNPRLIRLFEGFGYAIVLRSGDMVRLRKERPA
ncbi:MAG: GNAT family N-acetyltransferase [Planctomycetota bacterium]